jgi:methylenetetrahydrofolate--tRNA-(uracil-5-)-methyltransferase
MNANFGLLDELPERVRDKRRKRELFAERALSAMSRWIEEERVLVGGGHAGAGAAAGSQVPRAGAS